MRISGRSVPIMRCTPRHLYDDLYVFSRALGDPTRFTIFTCVRDAAAPVGVAELAERCGLHHNAVRQHLAKLVEAGLVVEATRATSGRGRPRLVYRPAPGAAERWGGVGPHAALAALLLELVRGRSSAREVGRRAGQRLAVEHGADADAVDILCAVARRLGFEPRTETAAAGTDVVLDRCPFADLAGAAPDIVCELHHGIAEGIAARAADGATVTGLLVRPPHVAGCRISVA